MKTIPFKGQDYESIKKNFNPKNLFVDPVFKSNMDSIAFSKSYQATISYSCVQWMRPNVNKRNLIFIKKIQFFLYFYFSFVQEICKNPKFVVEGFSRLDINQGALGDCWFIGGMFLFLNDFFQ